MHNLGDDTELDRLSRDAAGRYTPPGQPDWDTLSAELDKVMPVEKRKRRPLLFWWLLPLVVGALATAYWITRGEKNDAVTTTVVSPAAPLVENPAPDRGNGTNQATAESIQPDHKAATNTLSSPERASVATMKEKTVPAARYPITSKNSDGTHARPKHGETERTTTAKKIVAEPKETASSVPSVTSKENGAASVSEDARPAGAGVTQTSSATEPVKQAQEQADKSPGDTSKEQHLENTSPNKTSGAKTFAKRGKGFSVGAVVGVDESTVKFRYGNNAGYNMGVMLGYHFNDRLSLHTGAIYTQKNYKVAGADFTPPKGSWASYYKLETIDGYCRMWEVPLLARYTLNPSARNPVYLSTGLSSYFMTRENYDYTYYNNSGVLMHRNSAYNSTDRHILSILHLSAGFEHRLGKKLSMIIEPYGKLPLGGVGFGSIRLSSFGVNVGLQVR